MGKTIGDFLTKIRKDLGGECDDIIFSADDSKVRVRGGLKTGSYALDDGFGMCGGVPIKRITQFAGAQASGKTFMAMQVVKEWQALDPENWAVWVDAESSFEPDWADRLGVDISRLMIIKNNDGDMIFNTLCGVPAINKKTGKRYMKVEGILGDLVKLQKEAETEAINNKQDPSLARGHKCGVVVIDSVAAIVPPVEANYAIGHQNMAPLPRFLGPALRRVTPMVERANVAMIFINQLRISPNVMYGNPEISPGGSALKHYQSLAVNFGVNTAKENFVFDANDKKIGHRIMVKIQKSRISLSHDTTFVIKYLEGVIEKYLELADLAIMYGLVKHPNNITYEFGELKFKGREKLNDYFKDQFEKDADFAQKVLGPISEMKQAGIQADSSILGIPSNEEDEESQED